jgi:nucleoside-diphosphate-sugar epimerase
VPNVIRNALAGKPVPVYWQGEQIRDYIYVEDLAEAHEAVLGIAGLTTFNVGSETGVKVNDVLKAVEAILGTRLQIDDRGERPGDVPALYASSQRLREATGWQAKVGLDEGLERTIEFYRGLAGA